VSDLRGELPRNQGGTTGKHRRHNIAGRLCREQGCDLERRLRERWMMKTLALMRK